MTGIAIRSLQGEEYIDVLYNLDKYSFHANPPYQNKEEFTERIKDRKGVTYHALYENGKAVSGVASTAMTQNVRGKLFPMGGIWGVATHPIARRKGYVRQLMASILEADQLSGKVFSTLYPFRESFYERLGYTTFPSTVIARLAPSSLAPLFGKNLGGEFDLQLIGDAYDMYRDYIAEMYPHVHGMSSFDTGDLKSAQQNRSWVLLAKVDGVVDGLMLYSLQGEEISKFNFRATRFYYKTSRGRYLLLDWIARHTDQADRVEIWLSPDQHPETWLADMQVKVETQVRAPMGRVLNIAAIGGMETGVGSFSARISDPLCPPNNGTWRFESREGGLHVIPTGEADCDLTIQGISSLVYGTHDPQDFPLRGWGDPSQDVQAVMRSIFPPRLPYLHEFF